MIIGITGTDGAGKGTVVEYLIKEKNFAHCSARAVLSEALTQRGEESTRVNLRLIGNEMRAQYGNDFVVTHYLQKISEEKIQNAVIESIRAVDEAKTLKENDGILLAVDADQSLRYERVQERRSASDRVTFEQFVEHEALESNDPDPHGMQKQRVIAMADYVIQNNGTLDELHAEIEKVFQKILAQVR